MAKKSRLRTILTFWLPIVVSILLIAVVGVWFMVFGTNSCTLALSGSRARVLVVEKTWNGFSSWQMPGKRTIVIAGEGMDVTAERCGADGRISVLITDLKEDRMTVEANGMTMPPGPSWSDVVELRTGKSESFAWNVFDYSVDYTVTLLEVIDPEVSIEPAALEDQERSAAVAQSSARPKMGDSLPPPTGTSPMEGKWTWKSDKTVPLYWTGPDANQLVPELVFDLALSADASGNLYGSYTGVESGGRHVDGGKGEDIMLMGELNTDGDSSFLGRVVGDNHASASYVSNFASISNVVLLTYNPSADTLTWEVLPREDHKDDIGLVPVTAVLTRVSAE